ncbi:DUF262 domain-containing HNH endonuclease family protein [Burkholderia multivorans]|nr:DUF262 domain-containing HNH endonuclease family protein [Burkholderia multivorans]
MSKQTIETFFAGKNLVVPSYQRDYAWRERNIKELFADIEEALDVGGHYLGTFILSQKAPGEAVFVVDGQQRLTTLTMLLDALIDALENQGVRSAMHSAYISSPLDGLKFQVLGDNKDFFDAMLAKKNPTPESAGQTRLADAYEHIRLRVRDLVQQGGQPLVIKWLKALTKMEVLEFIEPDEGKAIRMFQTVNDRGVPLAKMDIVKSLLVYYSNRYLGGELDNDIAVQFGKAFRSFNNVKDLASEPGYQIRHIDRDAFREDDVLRYHYLAFDGSSFGVDAGGDYNATSESVLETFLKPALQKLRAEPDLLRSFIKNYTEDLTAFFFGLEAIVKATRTDRDTYMLLVVQDMNATLYPLVIRLQLKGWLPMVGDKDLRTLQELIEVTDMRVFKLKGTNPQADVFWITRELPNSTVSTVAVRLRNFCQKFMPDTLMVQRLEAEDIYRNAGVHRMLWEEEDQLRAELQLPDAGINELVNFNSVGLSVEHVLPQNPAFNIEHYGFADVDQYEEHKHRLGNLLLLEASLNSACQNKTVEEKVTLPSLYLSSGIKTVKALAATRSGASQGYRRENIEERGAQLAQLLLKRWPITCERPETKVTAAAAEQA